MALDKQYCIYGIDTSAFYFDDEREVERKMYTLRGLKSAYKAILKDNGMSAAVSFVIEEKYKAVSKELTSLKETLLSMMKGNMQRYRHINERKLTERSRISVFSSELTRSLDMIPLNLNVRQTAENTTVNEQMMVV